MISDPAPGSRFNPDPPVKPTTDGPSRSTDLRRTPTVLIVLAWLFVGVPAGWGVSQTLRTSLKLFTSAGPPPSAQPAHPSSH